MLVVFQDEDFTEKFKEHFLQTWGVEYTGDTTSDIQLMGKITLESNLALHKLLREPYARHAT